MPSKSPTRKTKSRRSSSKSQNSSLLTCLVLVVVLIFAGIYIVSGNDPLGLFTPAEETSPTSIPAAAQTAKPPETGGGSGGQGDWWEVYFTDPNKINNPEALKGSIEEKLIQNIDSAKKTIHIAAFEFNLTPVAEALIRAEKRGVEVQWVTDDENGIEADSEDDHGQFAMLEKAGIPVKDDGRSALMHNKFWIFDGKTVWTGSTNITINGNFRNNNNVIILKSPEVAAIYEREFSEMWDDEAFGPKSPSTVGQQSVTIQGTPIQIYFASEDDVISHLIPLVENAQKSIRFMAFSFTHDDLTAAMMKRAKAGVDLMGIFETRGSETEYSAMPKMYCAKIPVRQDGNPGTFHHKVIVIDEKIVVTGSLNFSANADEGNDENTVVIVNPDIAKLYLQEFDRRWAEATDPNKADMKCK